MSKLIFSLLIGILLISIVSAGLGLSDSSKPKLEAPQQTVSIQINETLFNVNDSVYWDGHGYVSGAVSDIEVDPLWTANSSLVGYLGNDNTWTGQNINGKYKYNKTGIFGYSDGEGYYFPLIQYNEGILYDELKIGGNGNLEDLNLTGFSRIFLAGITNYFSGNLQSQKGANLTSNYIYANNICYSNGTNAYAFNSTYNNLINQNCPNGQVMNGTYINGSIKCQTVSAGSSLISFTNKYVPYGNTTGGLQQSANLQFDGNNLTTKRLVVSDNVNNNFQQIASITGNLYNTFDYGLLVQLNDYSGASANNYGAFYRIYAYSAGNYFGKNTIAQYAQVIKNGDGNTTNSGGYGLVGLQAGGAYYGNGHTTGSGLLLRSGIEANNPIIDEWRQVNIAQVYTSASGSFTNLYGVYIDQQKKTFVNNSYGIYQSYSGDPNYFAGNTTFVNNVTLTKGSSYSNYAVCYLSGGTLGHCTNAVNSTGGCTCASN